MAIKEYKRNDLYEVEREARVLSCLQRNGHHPNLPFLIGAVSKSKPFLLVTQFIGYKSTSGAHCGLTLHDMMTTLYSEQFKMILTDVVQRLRVLHDSGCSHNDIKSDNVLLLKVCKSSYRGVLNDFGKARLLNKPKLHLPMAVQKTAVEKHTWIAPEVRQGTREQSVASDVYSFGMLIKKCLSRAAFESSELNSLADKCTKEDSSERPKTDFIIECLHKLQEDVWHFRSELTAHAL